MLVHSTLHHRLTELVPATPGVIGIYVCGATVQSEPHVGHGRYAVVFDMIRRYLVWRGNQVMVVRNITDIDDKIIAAAAAAGESVGERAKRISALFSEGYKALGVAEPDIEPKATEHILEMLELIGRLIERGLAYAASNGDVYFSVRTLETYGKLSGRKPDELRAGARVEVSEAKHDPLDFALWKAAKPGEPSWQSPWGLGRPGWHIECSAMALRYLGTDFAIHGGGNDLIFPHHENEIAQSEGATGETFARYWLHNGMLNLSGDKMSKSTGKLIDLGAAIERFGGMGIRLFYLLAHYRSPLDYSEELVDAASSAYDRLQRFLLRGRKYSETAGSGSSDSGIGDFGTKPASDVMDRFIAAMDEDFSTPEALAIVFDTVAEANRQLDDGGHPAELIAAVDEMVEVLGLTPARQELGDLAGDLAMLASELEVEGGTPEAIIESLLTAREKARSDKDFVKSDLIRDRLAAIGIVVEDTTDGARWLRR